MIRTHREGLVLLLVVLGIAAAVSAACAAEIPQSIILIGWDGAQRDHVNEMIARNELPNLMALAAEGTKVDVDVISGATDTKAGWTQILTGYKPEVTGVYSNSRYQPIPEGLSVFERLEKHFGPDNIVTMAIIGKKAHVDNDPPRRIPYDQYEKMLARARAQERQARGIADLAQAKIVEEDGQKWAVLPGKPWYIASQHMDLFQNGLMQNEVVATTAMRKLEENKDKRGFYFIHFAEPDHTGHAKGENSQEYTDALKDDDLWTGRIIAKLKELGTYDKTLVYVTADHGFNEGTTGHSYAPYVFLVTNDKTFVRTQGCREDIAPTILERFGVDLQSLTPPLDGIAWDQQAPERKAPPTKPAAGAGPRRQRGGATAGAAGGGAAGQAGRRQQRRQQQPGPAPQPQPAPAPPA